MAWTPPPRSPWVDKLNALGDNAGDGGRSMVSLDDDDLLAAATATTGLHDFGDDFWREPFSVFTASLRDEARLTLTGRLLARSEVQRTLASRLRLVDAWARSPEALQADVPGPIVITGLGRSGTTYLHELLTQDPANRVPMLWECMYPVPPPETATYATDPRIDAAHREITLMDEMVPDFTAMHENGGGLPTECIFIFAHQFVTDMWLGEYHVPGYAMWQSGVDRAPLYQFHRRVLQLLQYRCPGDRWVLKAPSHLSQLGTLFDTYPDARVVICHRDPLKVVGSLADLMATLQWMRSDHVDYETGAVLIALGQSLQLDAIIDQRASGALPEARINDVIYADLVRDPLGTVRRLYQSWGLEVSDEFADRLDTYVTARSMARHGQTHEYRFEDTGLSLADERERVASYMAHYGVPVEVG